ADLRLADLTGANLLGADLMGALLPHDFHAESVETAGP
ncbi:MAG: pentapeptide repeat-containing protein, partial [Caldilineaceae bacterium]|nr:pentapeptide repeat-containing protein [Caldilineaceae bacterium]